MAYPLGNRFGTRQPIYGRGRQPERLMAQGIDNPSFGDSYNPPINPGPSRFYERLGGVNNNNPAIPLERLDPYLSPNHVKDDMLHPVANSIESSSFDEAGFEEQGPVRNVKFRNTSPYRPETNKEAEKKKREQAKRCKNWDVFVTLPETDDDLYRSDKYFNKWKDCCRVIMTGVLALCVLGGGVTSLMTLLYAATNFRSDIKLICDVIVKDKCVSLNIYKDPYRIVDSDQPRFEELLQSVTCIPDDNLPTAGPLPGTCDSVMIRWGWCLLLIIITPLLLTFLRSTWLLIFKHVNKPKVTSLILVMIIEGFQTAGLTLLLFRVLPRLTSAAHGAALMLGTAFIPSLLNLFLKRSTEERSVLVLILDVIAVLIQLSALLLWPVLKLVRDDEQWDFDDDELIWSIPTSLLLTSLYWWDNFIPAEDDNVVKAGMSSLHLKVINLVRDIRNNRVIISMATSIWKILLTFLAFILWMMIDYDIDYMFDFEARSQDILCVDHSYIPSMDDDFVWVWIINVSAGIVTYFAARSAAKSLIQKFSYFLPLALTFPIVFFFLVGGCSMWNHDQCRFDTFVPEHYFWKCFDRGQFEGIFLDQMLIIAAFWWMSQLVIGRRALIDAPHKLSLTANVFSKPLFDGAVLNQWMFYNWSNGNSYNSKPIQTEAQMTVLEQNVKNQGRYSSDEEETPMIYMCATMWHENVQEMTQLFKSMYRCDVDQCAKRMARDKWRVSDMDFYNFEAHIFFDDAMKKYNDDSDHYEVNDFVTLMIEAVNVAGIDIYEAQFPIGYPAKFVTPYGGRLEWKMPGGNKLVVHLKDKKKVRHKKRWSQVMYMYYLLGFRLYRNGKIDKIADHALESKSNNTFILGLDGDVDFKAEAVLLLVDLMRKSEGIGAACGRIHPGGSGPMVWYQRFEYSLGHWMQKATEHVLGCVLCSPGCFSLFRASALMDFNVMSTYTKEPKRALDHLQFDQGEDRWLCTLLIQAGWKIEYSSICDSVTFVPEQFGEFYNQQRRWKPSTMANVYALINSAASTIRNNENISGLYIAYHTLLLLTSILGTSTIFLMVVEALSIATGDSISPWASLFINLVPLLLFIVVCFLASKEYQIKLALILSGLYSLLMAMVMIGIMLEIDSQGWCSPNALFFIMVATFFVVAALLHPQEFWNLPFGIIYFVAIPSMYMLLMIYSITNINDVSWGTREVQQTDSQKEEQQVEKLLDEQRKIEKRQDAGLISTIKNIKEEGFSLGIDQVFRCIMCPRPSESEDLKLEMIMESLKDVNRAINDLNEEKNGEAPNGERTWRPNKRKTVKEMRAQILQALKDDSDLDEEEQCFDTHDVSKPHWITKIDGELQKLDHEEFVFFEDLLDKFLYPLSYTKEQTNTMTRELKELRNTVAMGFFMLNALFTVIIFVMQRNMDQLSVDWPCGKEAINVQLDPMGFLFMIYFGSIMALQFLGMLSHRYGSFLHIVATRKEIKKNKRQKEMLTLLKKGLQENPDFKEYRGRDDSKPTDWKKGKDRGKKSRIFSKKHQEISARQSRYHLALPQSVNMEKRMTHLNRRITTFLKNRHEAGEMDNGISRALGGRKNTVRILEDIEYQSKVLHPFSNRNMYTDDDQPIPDYY